MPQSPPRPAMLIILDGWGWREDSAGQRHPPGAHPQFRPAVGRRAARLPAHLRRGCRAAGRADGQFRGRPPQHRRRPDRDAGPAAHRPRHRRRVAGHRPGHAGPDRRAERSRAAPATCSGSPPPAGCTRTRTTPPPSPGSWRRRASRSASTPSRTGATPRPARPPTTGRAGGRPARRSVHRDPLRPLLRARTVTTGGTGWASACAALVHAEGARFPHQRRPPSRTPTPHDLSDEFIPPAAIGDYARHGRRRRPAVLQLPRRPHPRAA